MAYSNLCCFISWWYYCYHCVICLHVYSCLPVRFGPPLPVTTKILTYLCIIVIQLRVLGETAQTFCKPLARTSYKFSYLGIVAHCAQVKAHDTGAGTKRSSVSWLNVATGALTSFPMMWLINGISIIFRLLFSSSSWLSQGVYAKVKKCLSLVNPRFYAHCACVYTHGFLLIRAIAWEEKSTDFLVWKSHIFVYTLAVSCVLELKDRHS